MARKKKVLKAGRTDFSDAKVMIFRNGTAEIVTREEAAKIEKADKAEVKQRDRAGKTALSFILHIKLYHRIL